jgi:ubiquinol-cytochrome c reductase cytochrome b subunit
MRNPSHDDSPATSRDESNTRAGEGFFGSRTGWRELKQRCSLSPSRADRAGRRRSAACCSSCSSLQIITGMLLTTCYAPSVGTAWQSVKYIQEEAPLGWFIRGMHHWGSSAMVILLLIHLIQVFVWGAYKRPRELTWMTGVLLLGATLGMAFTGYLLPWDEKAYWASKVGLGIVGTVPVIGQRMHASAPGRTGHGQPDADAILRPARFYHSRRDHRPDCRPSLFLPAARRDHRLVGKRKQLKRKTEPFWPGQVWKDGVVALGYCWRF